MATVECFLRALGDEEKGVTEGRNCALNLRRRLRVQEEGRGRHRKCKSERALAEVFRESEPKKVRCGGSCPREASGGG